MFTPIELRNRQFKPGRGYSRDEMDEFLDELYDSYEALYKENESLKEKVTKLSDGVQYYKSMETTLQKALILAEKTSSETIANAEEKAAAIEKEAREKADSIIDNANTDRDDLVKKSHSLKEQYESYKDQLRTISLKQIELLDSDFYKIDSDGLVNEMDGFSDDSSESVGTVEEAEELSDAAENDVSEIQTDTVDEPEPGNIVEDNPVAEEIAETEEKAETVTDNISEPAKEDQKSEREDPMDKFFKELRRDPDNDTASNISDSSFEFFDNE